MVVGCDSMLEIDGRVVGKPADAADARERWRTMSGGTGTLHTGHFLVRTADGAIAEGVSSATIRFGSPSPAEVEAYIASGEPLWCAGAFTIDGLGGAFIEGIDGDRTGSLASLCRCCAGSWPIWGCAGQTYGRRPPTVEPADDAHRSADGHSGGQDGDEADAAEAPQEDSGAWATAFMSSARATCCSRLRRSMTWRRTPSR